MWLLGFYPTPVEMEKKIDIFLKNDFCVVRNKSNMDWKKIFETWWALQQSDRVVAMKQPVKCK